ncbi:PREDICTED: metastasis-suppressor KiSS-1 [Miniopterus natalensis]|uniref:metastasis-suppressor KiSS-1 n=1 Tax=Miniopterus natalensis TaxID=291302 RepID=UPI0007A70A9E|nr:PREDICTED: metastasis-suppressor KiSS-1 [Miniopterus natalensis]
MNLLVSWQLLFFLCAISFRETLEKVAPMENPRSTGMSCLGKRVEGSKPTARPPGAPGRLGAEPAREKDLSAYNWNSFGLRYGRRRAAGGLPTPR